MDYPYGYGSNNNFPVGYPAQQYSLATPRVSAPVQQQAQYPQPQSGGILWCQGEAGAKSYPVAPGGSVLLMDSEGSRFYIKSADPSGMPHPLRIFEFREVSAQAAPSVSPVQQTAPAPDMSAFVTRDELEKRLAALMAPTQQTVNGGNADEPSA